MGNLVGQVVGLQLICCGAPPLGGFLIGPTIAAWSAAELAIRRETVTLAAVWE